MDLGSLVKGLRGIGGFTQEEFAEELFVSRPTISYLEHNKQTLDVPTLIRMVKVVNKRLANKACEKVSQWSTEPAAAVAISIGTEGLSMLQDIMQVFGVA